MTSTRWDAVYGRTPADQTSWHTSVPATSLRLVRQAAPAPRAVVDVGAGTSTLADHLLADGDRVTVLDVSHLALEQVTARLGEAVEAVVADVLTWQPEHRYDVWHDRAVFHFLVESVDRDRYVAVARAGVRPGGALVLGTFATDGPEQCSGLPTARYDAVSLATCFEPDFVLEHSEQEDHVTPWGAVQPFTWVILRRG